MSTPHSPVGAAADTTSPTTPTVTYYQQIADEFMKSLDQIAQIIPKLEGAHPSTANFVRSHQNIPNDFLGTAIAAVEQMSELQGVNKLDITAARDTLQFIDAFRPVLDKVTAFAKTLRYTMASRKASLAADALQIYAITKGIARDASASVAAVHVSNLKRDLGRRGPIKRTDSAKPATSTGGKP